MKKNIPNIITVLRIVLSITLLFFQITSLIFVLIYLLCGISDILDGYLARKLNVTSKLGSKLDSLADFIFVLVCVNKYYLTYFPRWLIPCAIFILVMKLINYVVNLIKNKSIVLDNHSFLNRLTGVILFFAPLSLWFYMTQYYMNVVLVLAFIASVDEFVKIIKKDSL